MCAGARNNGAREERESVERCESNDTLLQYNSLQLALKCRKKRKTADLITANVHKELVISMVLAALQDCVCVCVCVDRKSVV